MPDIIKKLINRATSLNDSTIADDISMLELLGEDANGNSEEFTNLLDRVTSIEKENDEAQAKKQAEESKSYKLTGVKKFKKLQKAPFAIGLNVYADDEFEVDLSIIKKQNPKFINQIKRALELKIIKVI